MSFRISTKKDDIDFEDISEVYHYLYQKICEYCKTDDKITIESSIEELLSTPCGARYTFRVYDKRSI